jgi:hypothetical protein
MKRLIFHATKFALFMYTTKLTLIMSNGSQKKSSSKDSRDKAKQRDLWHTSLRLCDLEELSKTTLHL